MDGVGYYTIIFPVSVRRTILPRGSYRFTAKKKLSTQLTVPSGQPQFELSLSELNHMLTVFAGAPVCDFLRTKIDIVHSCMYGNFGDVVYTVGMHHV